MILWDNELQIVYDIRNLIAYYSDKRVSGYYTYYIIYIIAAHSSIRIFSVPLKNKCQIQFRIYCKKKKNV